MEGLNAINIGEETIQGSRQDCICCKAIPPSHASNLVRGTKCWWQIILVVVKLCSNSQLEKISKMSSPRKQDACYHEGRPCYSPSSSIARPPRNNSIRFQKSRPAGCHVSQDRHTDSKKKQKRSVDNMLPHSGHDAPLCSTNMKDCPVQVHSKTRAGTHSVVQIVLVVIVIKVEVLLLAGLRVSATVTALGRVWRRRSRPRARRWGRRWRRPRGFTALS
ncbi:hypothetical protein B0T19DRAFT_200478 [Cercophora scortea]|uniref:Uncharacterized protein n=1 Tax=Cercophora scortea TaxID=314031 RepID=A0AAE0IFD1_9PEZI|nr:hypothetical protein B0T19DRAFT_200478 [Cercophora scortea]